MSDDTPTERFTAPTAPTPAVVDDEPRSRTLLYVLIGVGAALVIAIIILLIVLTTRDQVAPDTKVTPSASASPTPTVTSPSPSPTPTPEPTEDAPPPPPADEDDEPEPQGPIKSFSVDDTTVNCDSAASVPLQFSWNTTGQTLWFGVGTNNAKNAPFDTFPLVHTLDFDYQCGQSNGQQTYTITVEQSNGDLLSKTITVKE